MLRSWRLGTRNWSVSKGRTSATVVSVALGVGTVVTIAAFHNTAWRTLQHEVFIRWLGDAELTIHPLGGHWGALDTALVEPIRELDNVAHVAARLKRKTFLRAKRVDASKRSTAQRIDAIGIEAGSETVLQQLPGFQGRRFRTGERGVAVIERELAVGRGLGIGDPLTLATRGGARKKKLAIVGVFDSQRVADFQSPYVYLPLAELQALTGEPNTATAIEIKLEDASAEALEQTRRAVEEIIRTRGMAYRCSVETAAARQTLLAGAERVARLSLLLVSFVAMLSAFFIILTTMTISLFERRTALGVMRCVGLTRGQLVRLLVVEILPLGLLGTLLGLAGGAVLAYLAGRYASGTRIDVTLGTDGVWMAAAAGVGTTAVAILFLAAQVLRVSPLSALNPQAKPPRIIFLYLAGLPGLLLIGLHEVMVAVPDQLRWLEPAFAGLGTASLYLGYVLVTPPLVVLLGPRIARVVGRLIGLHPRLAEDQFGRAPWRSTGVCWMLLVGLSLIVYLAVGANTLLAVYNFPSELPEVFVWSRSYVPGQAVEKVRALAGVSNLTAVSDVDCKIVNPDAGFGAGKGSMIDRFLANLSRPVFVACEPARLLRMVQVTFDEGTMDDAIDKLSRGGYVLIPTQTSRNKNLHLGDRVEVGIKDRSVSFEVAGVVQSPILDLTVTAFQARSYLQFAAASVVFGTHEDLRTRFGLDVAAMILCDIDLSPGPPPKEFQRPSPPTLSGNRERVEAMLRWLEPLPNELGLSESDAVTLRSWLRDGGKGKPPPAVAAAVAQFRRAMHYTAWMWERETPEQRWELLRERLVLARIAGAMERPGAVMGSLRRMKAANERAIRRAAGILTWLPSIVLAVSAIGIGNLMMVSVKIRSRQLAVLRAIGAVKSQVVRIVLAEAVSLGLVGSVCGVGLGIHQAISDNRVTGALIGIQPKVVVPVGTILVAVALTLAVCLLAGLLPARHAARGNIADAMRAV